MFIEMCSGDFEILQSVFIQTDRHDNENERISASVGKIPKI